MRYPAPSHLKTGVGQKGQGERIRFDRLLGGGPVSATQKDIYRLSDSFFKVCKKFLGCLKAVARQHALLVKFGCHLG